MEDAGGKSGRCRGSHLQVEASRPGNARSAHWRLAGRLRRGKVTEGCVGGAAGRSKGLICLHVTWMEDRGGKSGRRPGRHRQVEAFDPDATIAQRSLVSWRTRWSCDLEVWAWAVGRLAPSTFPPVGAGGLAHLGSRRLPRMRYLADEITAAAATQGSKRAQACRMRATAHTLSGASPTHHAPPRAHARPSRRTCE